LSLRVLLRRHVVRVGGRASRPLSTYDWRRDHAVFNARCSEADDGPSAVASDGRKLSRISSATVPVSPMALLKLTTQGDTQVVIATENEKCEEASFEIVAIEPSTSSTAALSVEPDGRGGVLVSVRDCQDLEGAQLRALIPEKFCVEVMSQGRDVSLARLEGSAVLHTQGGSITMDKVSEGPIELASGGGSVDCRVINCDAKIDTAGGDFSSKRMQGLNFQVSTAAGNIDVGALYATAAKVRTTSGAITLGSINALTELSTESGAIVVRSGADGDLEVKSESGLLDIQLGMSIDCVNATTAQGDIKISAPLEFAASSVVLHGQRGVQIDPAFDSQVVYDGATAKGSIGDKPSSPIGRGYKPKLVRIQADAPAGRVDVMTQGWLASLGIKDFS